MSHHINLNLDFNSTEYRVCFLPSAGLLKKGSTLETFNSYEVPMIVCHFDDDGIRYYPLYTLKPGASRQVYVLSPLLNGWRY